DDQTQALELHAMSEHINLARKKVEEIISTRREVDADGKSKKSDNPLEQAARDAGASVRQQHLLMAQHELSTILQNDVLNDALGLNKSDKTQDLLTGTKFESKTVDTHSFTPLSSETGVQRTNTPNPSFSLQ